MKLTYFDFGLGVTGMVPTSEAVHIYKKKHLISGDQFLRNLFPQSENTGKTVKGENA